MQVQFCCKSEEIPQHRIWPGHLILRLSILTVRIVRWPGPTTKYTDSVRNKNWEVWLISRDYNIELRTLSLRWKVKSNSIFWSTFTILCFLGLNPSSTVEVLYSTKALIGEGPFYEEETGLLIWIDIMGKTINFLDPIKGTNRCLVL